MTDPVADLYNKSFQHHKEGQLDKAMQGYMALLNRKPYDPTLLYLVGNVHLQRSENGAAITYLRAAIDEKEDMGGAWNDLGCALKAEHFDEAAAQAWETAVRVDGETAGTLNNLATLWADSGYPERALPYIEKAQVLDPTNPHVHWNNALARLSLGDWERGWPEHEYRYEVSSKSVSARHYGPRWQREPEGLLVVHGEQGLGDEVMFMSCLPDLMREHPDIVIECERKLVKLVERSFGVPAYATEAEVKEAGHMASYQIGMGSLPLIYRMSDDDFPGGSTFTPYLKADPELVEEARALLRKFHGPRIGVSWMGGTKTTRVQHRSLSAAAVKALLPKGATGISLQYGELADVEADAAGLVRLGPWTDGTDLDKLAAMLVALDDVASVCTTLIHLAGGLGVPVRILTPLRSSWRYGTRRGPGAMPWYPLHTLYRQEVEGDWTPVLTAVAHDLKEKFA